MIVRRLALLALLALVTSAAAAGSGLPQPKPLRGVPLTGSTGLRLLVADDPPFLLDPDTGRITRITGLNVRGRPVLSVQAVGKDAVVWLDRRAPVAKVPSAEIYVVRHGSSAASRIATGWEVAASADGRAVWLESFSDARHCALGEVGLDGHQRRSPRPLPCSTHLIDAGGGALLVQENSIVDPLTGRTLLRTGGLWAIAGRFALTSEGPLTLTDLRSGARRQLSWPSQISGTDQAAVEPHGRLVALSFSDPAYQGSGTQVTDVWLLDPSTRRFQHLPDMPAAVDLKFTSMSWTGDGRLVMLAQRAGRDIVAVWRPGQKRIAVRTVRLPVRDSGSDAFVVWG